MVRPGDQVTLVARVDQQSQERPYERVLLSPMHPKRQSDADSIIFGAFATGVLDITCHSHSNILQSSSSLIFLFLSFSSIQFRTVRHTKASVDGPRLYSFGASFGVGECQRHPGGGMLASGRVPSLQQKMAATEDQA